MNDKIKEEPEEENHNNEKYEKFINKTEIST